MTPKTICISVISTCPGYPMLKTNREFNKQTEKYLKLLFTLYHIFTGWSLKNLETRSYTFCAAITGLHSTGICSLAQGFPSYKRKCHDLSGLAFSFTSLYLQWKQRASWSLLALLFSFSVGEVRFKICV